MRIDVYLYEHKYASSRTQARLLVEAGGVCMNGSVVLRPSTTVTENDEVTVHKDNTAYVGRGGYKLEAALKSFSVSVCGSIALDIGASTGGFTDCLLRNGAKEVYAIDAGHGQLATELRNRPAVHNIEHCNARYLTAEMLGKSFDSQHGADIIVMDVSFISQTCILPALLPLLHIKGYVISLIKPQFELEKGKVGRGGIVKKASERRDAVERVCLSAKSLGLVMSGLICSPITGGDGNVEFLAAFHRRHSDNTTAASPLSETAHNERVDRATVLPEWRGNTSHEVIPADYPDSFYAGDGLTIQRMK